MIPWTLFPKNKKACRIFPAGLLGLFLFYRNHALFPAKQSEVFSLCNEQVRIYFAAKGFDMLFHATLGLQNMWRVLSLAFLGLTSLPMLASDLTLTTSFESTGPTGHVMQHSSTLMIHDQRSRAPGQNYVGNGQGKTYGPRFAIIGQCDLKQNI
ncbi:MAG TPA: hypothetical protein VK798_05435, partial [Alloacidobacterium sp.]|nr:hypothetical protein [Alloacidobacterium sp.]